MRRINRWTRSNLESLARRLAEQLPEVKKLKEQMMLLDKSLRKDGEKLVLDIPPEDIQVLEKYGYDLRRNHAVIKVENLDHPGNFWRWPEVHVQFKNPRWIPDQQIVMNIGTAFADKYYKLQEITKEYQALCAEKVAPYQDLINSTSSSKKILEIWPEASEVLCEDTGEQNKYDTIIKDMQRRAKLNRDESDNT